MSSKLPINLDVMRQFRSSLLYDTLAFRLNGKLDLPREYGKYKRQATHRAFRRTRRQLERITPRQARDREARAPQPARRARWTPHPPRRRPPPPSPPRARAGRREARPP